MWLKFALTYAFVTILSCALKLSSIFMSVKILVRCKNHYKLESILTIFFLRLHKWKYLWIDIPFTFLFIIVSIFHLFLYTETR